MSIIRRLSAGRAAFRDLCVVAVLATWLIDANAATPIAPAVNQGASSDDQAPQAPESVKPGADGAPPSGKPAVDPNAPRPPMDANADARELVKRRMELCRLRPEICMQEGKNRDEGDKRPPEGTSKD